MLLFLDIYLIVALHTIKGSIARFLKYLIRKQIKKRGNQVTNLHRARVHSRAYASALFLRETQEDILSILSSSPAYILDYWNNHVLSFI